MSVKEEFKFGGGDFSVSETSLVDLDNFLGGDPDEVTKIATTPDSKKATLKKSEKTEEDESSKKKPEAQVRQVNSDDFFAESEEDDDEKEESKEDEELEVFKKKKAEEVKDEKKEEKKPEESESPYTDLTKDLLSLGVFTPDEDEEGNEIPLEIKTGEEFLGAFQNQVKKQVGESIEKFLERFGPEYSDMFNAVYVNGVPPYEYISRQSKIDNIQDYDITTEENQEKIMRQWYSLEGRTAENIEAKIQKLKNYADLEDEAKVAKDLLVAREQKDLQNLAARKREELQNKQRMKSEYVNSVGRIISEKLKAKDFDGIPLEKRFAEQTLSYLTKDVYETKDTKQPLTEFDRDILELNRPENHNNKVKLAMLLQIIKTDPTLSRLGKKAISKESSKLFSEVERKYGKSKPTTRDTEELSSPNNW